MSLTLGAVNTDIVDIGSGSSIDDLDPFSILTWINVTTLTSGRVLFRKATGVKLYRLSGTTGDLQVSIVRATTNTSYITNSTPLSATGTWLFVAMTYNSVGSAGEVVNIYKGTLAAAAAECTYGTATDGSGNLSSDAASNAGVGNGISQGNAFQGQIANYAIFNRELSFGEIVSWQFDPRVLAGCVAFYHFGFNGASTQPDYSGNANAGTVTGATQSSHVPLRAPWNRRIQYVPIVAAGGGTTVLPDIGALTLTGLAPTIVTPQTVLPGVGGATLTGFAPTILTPQTPTPGVGVLTLAGFAPTIVTPQTVLPGVGVALVAGFAPTILAPRTVLPGVGALTLAGFAPTIQTSAGASPGAGALTLTGFAPTILAAVAAVPGIGVALLTGYAPTVIAAAPPVDNIAIGVVRDRSPMVSVLDRSPAIRAKDRGADVLVRDRSHDVAVYGRDLSIRIKNRESSL